MRRLCKPGICGDLPLNDLDHWSDLSGLSDLIYLICLIWFVCLFNLSDLVHLSWSDPSDLSDLIHLICLIWSILFCLIWSIWFVWSDPSDQSDLISLVLSDLIYVIVWCGNAICLIWECYLSDVGIVPSPDATAALIPLRTDTRRLQRELCFFFSRRRTTSVGYTHAAWPWRPSPRRG